MTMKKKFVAGVAAGSVAALIAVSSLLHQGAPAHPENAPHTVGTWGTVCQTATHFGRVDPIVAFGGTSAHDHEFFGSVVTNKSSLPSNLLAHATRCKSTKDGYGVDDCLANNPAPYVACSDFSAYWAPTLRLNGTLVPVQNMVAYYSLGRALNGTAADETTRLAEKAFPANMEMVAGNGASTDWTQPVKITKWGCGDVTPSSPQDHPPVCVSASNTLHLEVYFPQCGDTDVRDSVLTDPVNWASGMDQTTGNGDHMAYLNQDGTCHAPYDAIVFPQLDVDLDYGLWGNYNPLQLQLSSDVDGDPSTWCTTVGGVFQAACSAHADFMMGWDPTNLQEFINTCVAGPLAGPVPSGQPPTYSQSPPPPPPSVGPHNCGQIDGQPYGH